MLMLSHHMRPHRTWRLGHIESSSELRKRVDKIFRKPGTYIDCRQWPFNLSTEPVSMPIIYYSLMNCTNDKLLATCVVSNSKMPKR